MVILLEMPFNSLPTDIRPEADDGTVLALKMPSTSVFCYCESGVGILDLKPFENGVEGSRGLT
jgi:hypothetical protein